MVRVALITGGTRGLGRTIALRLAKDGHVPALLHRDNSAAAEEALEALRAGSEATGDRARAYQADIGDRSSVEAAIARIHDELGPVEILVNNAYRAGRTPKKTHEVEPDELAEDLSTNLIGQFLVTRAAIPSMLEQGFGRIVFIGSLAMRGERGRVAYAIAKSGLVGLMKTVAQEYAKSGITANIVSPGFIEAGAFLRFSAEIRERAVSLVPSKRAGRPEDVAAAVSYLCSEDAGYTNGQVLGIDGGAV